MARLSEQVPLAATMHEGLDYPDGRLVRLWMIRAALLGTGA